MGVVHRIEERQIEGAVEGDPVQGEPFEHLVGKSRPGEVGRIGISEPGEDQAASNHATDPCQGARSGLAEGWLVAYGAAVGVEGPAVIGTAQRGPFDGSHR